MSEPWRVVETSERNHLFLIVKNLPISFQAKYNNTKEKG